MDSILARVYEPRIARVGTTVRLALQHVLTTTLESLVRKRTLLRSLWPGVPWVPSHQLLAQRWIVANPESC